MAILPYDGYFDNLAIDAAEATMRMEKQRIIDELRGQDNERLVRDSITIQSPDESFTQSSQDDQPVAIIPVVDTRVLVATVLHCFLFIAASSKSAVISFVARVQMK